MPNSNLLLPSKYGRLKINIQIKSQIVTSDRTATRTPSTAAHPTSKEGVKNITEINLLSKGRSTSERRPTLSFGGGRRSYTTFSESVVA
jgi:hypothetical protein